MIYFTQITWTESLEGEVHSKEEYQGISPEGAATTGLSK